MQPAFQNLLLTIPGLRERLVELPAPGEALLAHLERATGPATRSAEIGFSLCSLALAARVAEHVAILPDAAAEAAVRALAQARGWPIPALAIRQGDVVAQAMALPAAGFDRVILSAPLAFPAQFAALEAAMRALKVNGRLILRGAGVWTLEQSRNFLRADPAWGDAQPVGPDAFTFRKLAPHAAGPGDWARQPFVAMNSGLAHAEAVKSQASFGLRNVVGDFFRPRPAAPASASGPRLRLGLSGYYGFGNYGDELFRQAFAQGFAGHELTLLHDLPRRPYYLSDKAAKVAAVDAIVIGGGDLVIPGYWTDFYFEEEWLAKPVFIHGVGVPRWTGGEPPVIRRLRAFFQHPNVRHVNVRDAESKAWVEKHLAPAVPVELSPDLVWGVGFEAERAGARKGPPGKPVFGLITRRQGVDPKAYDALAGLLRDARSRGYHIRLIVAGTGLVGEEDLDDARRVNLPADELAVGETVEDVTEAILGCDVLASMKFHGCIVGNANRIPTFALLTTDKFVNFYRAAGIEDRLVFYGDARAQKLLEKGVPPPLSEAVVARERDGALAAMARLRAKLEAAVAGRPG